MSNIANIQEALRSYNPDNKKSLAELYFQRNEYTMTWQINNLCNYNCAYCGHFVKDDPDVYKYSPEHIAGCFNKKDRTWHIIITGGEPFLYKNIIELTKLLTARHYISVNTNLSLSKVAEFADTIDPSRVIIINASIHYFVHEEKKTLENFISNFLYLQEKGFNIVGSYVVYPTLLEHYKNHFAYLHSRGLKNLSVKIFHGNYQNKKYPEAYTENELAEMTTFMCSEIEMPEYLKYTKFTGLKCSTGRKMLSMMPNGNLERCLSDHTPVGNFFTGKYRLPWSDKKCSVPECLCPYQGMLFSKNKKNK
jgi:MoaA/NifB/PqqE/SkfB family radical SAM enzyme